MIGHDTEFAWNVWSSLSRENFERAIMLWESPGRTSEPPYFGWLSTDLGPVYPMTLNLRVQVHTREVGRRPYFEVEPTNHSLTVEHRSGITLDGVREINALMRHQA